MAATPTSSSRWKSAVDKLSAYDDICTDLLVDKVEFWSQIHKMAKNYKAVRKPSGDDVVAIIRQMARGGTTVSAADKIVKLDGLKTFVSGMSDDDRTDFHQHVQRYLAMYLPTTPFEVGTTERYNTSDTPTKHEACALATQTIHKGETIDALTGIFLPLTRDEEDQLKEQDKDWSVLVSGRKGNQAGLFLGPGRFVNHDCDANTMFQTLGGREKRVGFNATKDITKGTEITTFYGRDYFGEGNALCLCSTCEQKGQGGYSLSGEVREEKRVAGLLLRNKKIITTTNDGDLPTPPPTTDDSATSTPFPSLPPSGDTTSDTSFPKTADITTKKRFLQVRCTLCQELFPPSNSWWTLVICPRCFRHAAVYDLRYPQRIPPSNDSKHYFGLQLANRSVQLQSLRSKARDGIIDLSPFPGDEEQRVAKSKRTSTAETEVETSPPAISNKRKHPVEEISRRSPKSKAVLTLHNKSPRKRRESALPTTPQPQPTEYDAATSSARSLRTQSKEPESPTHTSKAKVSSAGSVARKKSGAEDRSTASKRRAVSAVDVPVSPTSPKITEYDKFQELQKKGKVDAAVGAGRSRRPDKRSLSMEMGTPLSSPKRRKKEMSARSGSNSTPQLETSATGDAVSDGLKSSAETTGLTRRKRRRKIRSLSSDEIVQDKTESDTVQASYLHEGITSSTSHVVEQPSRDDKPKRRKVANSDDRPVEVKEEHGAALVRQNGQSSTQLETQFSDRNGLDILAAVAIEEVSKEGITYRHRTV